MTRSELATWIVRMGEKYPDRVGAFFMFHGMGNCVLGEIGIQSGACAGSADIFSCSCHPTFYPTWDGADPTNDNGSLEWLAGMAANLNNHGMQWGEIPKLLGLVPGEQPAEFPLTQPDTFTQTKETADAAL